MIWQIIDEDGNVSKPLVTKGTMNLSTYLKCLKEYLLPFIKKYKNKNILFWQDMAARHYSKEVTEWMTSRKEFKFVSRKNNAPNVSQARPIEKFWAICKQ